MQTLPLVLPTGEDALNRSVSTITDGTEGMVSSRRGWLVLQKEEPKNIT